MDKKRTWEQVDDIIAILKRGCEYLDFPEHDDIRKYMMDDGTGMMHERELAASPLTSPKMLLAAARGSLKAPGQLRIDTSEEHGPFCNGAKEDGETHIANKFLENIVEENAQDDGDTSLEKNPGELQLEYNTLSEPSGKLDMN